MMTKLFLSLFLLISNSLSKNTLFSRQSLPHTDQQMRIPSQRHTHTKQFSPASLKKLLSKKNDTHTHEENKTLAHTKKKRWIHAHTHTNTQVTHKSYHTCPRHTPNSQSIKRYVAGSPDTFSSLDMSNSTQ